MKKKHNCERQKASALMASAQRKSCIFCHWEGGDISYKIDKYKIVFQHSSLASFTKTLHRAVLLLLKEKSQAEVKKMLKIAVSCAMKVGATVFILLNRHSQILSALVAVTFAGVIHEHSGEHADVGTAETEHHHHINHKHAESHQSVKFIHYHAVPVYVKKEDQKYLSHPVEIGSNKHKLKLVHPETEHAKGYGLTLENHSEYKNHKIEHPHHDHHAHASESHEQAAYEVQPEFDFEAYEAAHH